MDRDDNRAKHRAELRRRAEQILLERTRGLDKMTQEDINRLIHELSVHQIELEIQNEELIETHIALQKALEKQADLYDFAPAGYFTLNRDNRIMEANLSGAALVGEVRNELTRAKFTDFIAPESQDTFYLCCREILKTGAGNTCQIRMRKKGGEPFYARLQIAPQQDDQNATTKFRVSMLDITGEAEAKIALQKAHDAIEITVRERTAELDTANQNLKQDKASLEMAQEELLLRANLLDAASDAIMLRIAAGKPVYANQAALKLYGYSWEELRQMSAVDLMAAEERPEHALRVKELQEKGEIRVETVHVRRDKTILPVEVYATRLTLRGNDYTLSVTRDITQRKKAEAELKTFPARLIEAQEKERRFIGRELHDQAGQNLTALKLLLARLSLIVPEASAEIKEASDLAQGVLLQVRELSLNMRPPMIDDNRLLPALLWQFERITAQTGLKVNIEQEGLDGKNLPNDTVMTAFRIIQEAVTNVMRYAEVSEATVKIKATGPRLIFSVEDKGRGFDLLEAENKASSGLINMRERAALLGGKCVIRSAPGEGTTISAELPLL